MERFRSTRTSVSSCRGCVPGEREREPFRARISTPEPDAVDELGENAAEALVVATPSGKGPHRYGNETIPGFDLDRDLVSVHRFEDAQQRELEVVSSMRSYGRGEHDRLDHLGVASFIHDLGPRDYLNSSIVSGTGHFDVQLVSMSDGACAVRVVGDLDMATAPELEERIASVVSASRLVIDLTQCTFLDSAAVRALMTIARDADTAGTPLALVASDPGILRVLEITAVDDILPVHSVDEAL